MKIVISISEDTYKRHKWRVNHDACTELDIALANGTSLPKGHGRLIDVNRKITVSTYDEQYEEWGEKTLTILEALNKWSDEGVTAKDIVIRADEESEDEE